MKLGKKKAPEAPVDEQPVAKAEKTENPGSRRLKTKTPWLDGVKTGTGDIGGWCSSRGSGAVFGVTAGSG